jgi:hypothetical protein
MAMKPEMVNELRHMVREVLRDALPQRAPKAESGSVAEVVNITSDRDLQRFIARITEPATADKIRNGKLRFTLGNASAQHPVTPTGGAHLTGVITERKIDQIAAGHMLILGPGAVLTPLARDRARRLGLTIERRR